MKAIECGKLPLIEEHKEARSLWSLLVNCWSVDPDKRPTMENVLADLQTHVSEALSEYKDYDLTQKVHRAPEDRFSKGTFTMILEGVLEDRGRAEKVVLLIIWYMFCSCDLSQGCCKSLALRSQISR